ncbi:MAG: hypothetical protein AAFV62_03965 [Pseudomonadota bacterium]
MTLNSLVIAGLLGFGTLAVPLAPFADDTHAPLPIVFADYDDDDDNGDDDYDDAEDLFDAYLFDPEEILEHGAEIRLSDAQRSALIDRVVGIQSQITRQELEMAGSLSRLFGLMEAEQIDVEAVMPIVDLLLTFENETKREYLRLMIESRNALTPAQRQKLYALRED